MRLKHAKEGDITPWKKKFAFLPVIVQDKNNDYHTIWWEHYMTRKKYGRTMLSDPHSGYYVGWGWAKENRMIENA